MVMVSFWWMFNGLCDGEGGARNKNVSVLVLYTVYTFVYTRPELYKCSASSYCVAGAWIGFVTEIFFFEDKT